MWGIGVLTHPSVCVRVRRLGALWLSRLVVVKGTGYSVDVW